ncbi:MAG: class I SAM-dependent methyltransferase [Sulfitobacter sp.]
MDNTDQADFWGGDAGDIWVEQQAQLDAQMQPVLEGLLARANLTRGLEVLDIGCGTGQSTLAVAKEVGTTGHVLGADISPQMLALARTRAQGVEQASFERTDVATHDFAPAHYDRVISRFGVMFFADPVAAFANIAKAMKPGAQMVLASWGQIENNPWFTLPARVAKAEIGAPPKADPDEPGPFAFRDIARVEGILREAGLMQVRGTAVDMRFQLPGGAAQFGKLAVDVGPARRALDHFNCDEATRQRLIPKLTQAFAELPDEAIPAEINFFTCVA